MTLTRPWSTDAAFPNAADRRKQIGGLHPREGLLPDPITVATAGVAFAGAGWGVSARAFNAIVKRAGVPYSQAYGAAAVSNDGTVANAWTLTPAPASGSRIDLLCIRVRDVSQGDSATGAPTDGPGGATRSGLAEWVTVTGVSDTSPVAPTLPAGHLEIARAVVPNGAVSAAGATISQTYAFAHVVGGTLYVRSIADRNALSGDYLLPGDAVVVLATGYEYIRTAAGGWAYGRCYAQVTPAKTPNWTTYAGDANEDPRAELVNGVVQFYGRVSGTSAAAQRIFAALPVGMRPARALTVVGHSDDGPTILGVNLLGQVFIYSRSGQSRGGVSLGDITYTAVPE